MKVPPKSPSPQKDKTITRRTVKGAAGGMLGVHYEDPRHNDVNTVRSTTEAATSGAGENRDGSAAATGFAAGAGAAAATESGAAPLGGPKEESELVLDDEDASTRDAKKRQRQQFQARDRLTIDKDAPELRRTKALWKKIVGDDDDDPEEGASGYDGAPDPEELDPEAIAEAISAAGDDVAVDTTRFEQPGRSRLGDPSLTDPAAIQAALGSPIAYAKHVMILGEAFARGTGAHRPEVVAYMAAMYAALPDQRFARQALKEFGPSTGILDVYPLEVVETLLLRYPGVLPKVGFGRLLVRPPGGEEAPLALVAGRPTVLLYPASLKIRGFALRGGAHPGYLFEPGETPGRYLLQIDAPGRYEVLISGLTRDGHAIVDRLRVQVRPAGRRPRPASAPAGAEATPRDEAKVAAWPVPAVPSMDARALLEAEAEAPQDPWLSSGEIVSRQQQDALRGPLGEGRPPSRVDDMEPGLMVWSIEGDEIVDEPEAPPREPHTLSSAEQAILRLAFATQVSADDLFGPEDAPPAFEEPTGIAPVLAPEAAPSPEAVTLDDEVRPEARPERPASPAPAGLAADLAPDADDAITTDAAPAPNTGPVAVPDTAAPVETAPDLEPAAPAEPAEPAEPTQIAETAEARDAAPADAPEPTAPPPPDGAEAPTPVAVEAATTPAAATIADPAESPTPVVVETGTTPAAEPFVAPTVRISLPAPEPSELQVPLRSPMDEPEDTALVPRRAPEPTMAEAVAWTPENAPGFSDEAASADPLVRPPPPSDPGPPRPTPDQRRLVTEVVRVRKTPRGDQGASVPVDDLVLTETDED